MEKLFMTFISYSLIGWLWESFYCSFKAKHFVYRGFLLGPYCPVYGFGVAAVLFLLPQQINSLLPLYLYCIVIVTLIEYITSWLLEKLFNMTLWNYKDVPLNIHGRVALPVSIFWGIGCLVLIKFINPIIQDGIINFSDATKQIGPLILFIIFMLDCISTLYFTLTTKKDVEKLIDQSDTENAAIKEFRLKHLFTNQTSSKSRDKVLALIKNKPHKLKHRNLNRIVKNYPNIHFKK